MKRYLVFLLMCSIAFLCGMDLKLTEGVWYMSSLQISGEIMPSGTAFRLNADGSAELVLDEKARQLEEKFRQDIKKRTGKELPVLTYSWEWKDAQLKLHAASSAMDNFQRTDVYVPFEGRDDILKPLNKSQFILFARKGARLSAQKAKEFFELLKEANRDKFADNLKLPENIPLAEPEKELCNIHFFNRSHWRDPPEGSFQQFVLNAIGKGPKLAEDEQCQLPSLAAMQSTPEAKAVLLQYLACNPEWHLYREAQNTLHAVRCFRYPDGTIASTLHQHYAHFLPTVEDGKKVGDLALEFQFRFEIALNGTVWNSSAMFPRDKTEHRGNTWDTRFKCGEALVNILDQTQFEGRQMTAAALACAEKEFASLYADLKNWRDKLPRDSVRIGKPELILRDGMQGGIYEAEIWCNPGEKGMVYLKAFEITQGTQLSAKRLKQCSNCMSGWSGKPDEMFASTMEITIYEGEWEQFYGARFEIWFKPDADKPERKLFEKNYKIQGWQR